MAHDAAHGGLERRLEYLLDRRRRSSTLRTLSLAKPTQVDFSSNDFLSLSTSPILRALFRQEVQSSELPLGSGGSRLLDGNSAYAESLEHEIATFHGAEAGLLFNSGFDANAGFFACVPQPGDVVVYDELVHASVHDGMKLSRAGKTISFSHNSVDGLKKLLETLWEEDDGVRNGSNHVFVAVESIYSMDGDVAPLRDIVHVVEAVLGTDRGYVVVDEAHSTGVLGRAGRGLVCELELERRVFARLHTFGKAVAANGAIILGSTTLRHYLVNYARPLIYTTFLSYPSLCLIRASYTLLRSGQAISLQAHLHHLTEMLYTRMKHLQRDCAAVRSMLKLPSACPKSPIFAIQLDKPKLLAAFLQGQGMMVRAVMPPTVRTKRVRICLHAGNTMAEVEDLARALRAWCETRAAGTEGTTARARL